MGPTKANFFSMTGPFGDSRPLVEVLELPMGGKGNSWEICKTFALQQQLPLGKADILAFTPTILAAIFPLPAHNRHLLPTSNSSGNFTGTMMFSVLKAVKTPTTEKWKTKLIKISQS